MLGARTWDNTLQSHRPFPSVRVTLSTTCHWQTRGRQQGAPALTYDAPRATVLEGSSFAPQPSPATTVGQFPVLLCRVSEETSASNNRGSKWGVSSIVV